MKRRILTTQNLFEKRALYEQKYAQLEKRREELDKKIRREEREARIENAKSEVKAVSKKARKYAKKTGKESGVRRQVSVRCRRTYEKRVSRLAYDFQFPPFAQDENPKIRAL